jgi:quinol monooxygenase YgiN
MDNEILALAILEPLPGKEDELVEMLRELYALMFQKGYSHDVLYKDPKRPGSLVHLRYWTSKESRDEAQQDPEVHKYWLRLPELCVLTTVHEELETVVQFK